jgi:hypothetical protein
MLYKLERDGDGLGTLDPLPFLDAADLQRREKHVENLLAEHLLDVLFEDAALLPIFQERSLQAEADLYALTRNGDMIIFELKRGVAGEDAILQAIGYAQQAGRWPFSELQRRYRKYLERTGMKSVPLQDAHKEAFQLEQPLLPTEFNRRQTIFVVGSAANESLVSAIDYWKGQGLSVEFLPYRIYNIGDDYYFEFFSFPYDRHRNPAAVKGVLFDTNRSYDEDAIWEMMEKARVAAYGNIKHVVEYLSPRDIVFFSHKWTGVVAAAEVVGPVKGDGPNEEYRDVRFLTPTPKKDAGTPKAMPFWQVSQVTGKGFFWARTIKVPYLSREEALSLLEELRKVLQADEP